MGWSDAIAGATSDTDNRFSLATAVGQLNLRPPTQLRDPNQTVAASQEFVLPDLPWLQGTWYISASSLPMWRNKKNAKVEYTRIKGDRLDDVVSYQNSDNKNVKKLHGIDKQKKDGSWTWRGRGKLIVASSRWEILGWGGGGPEKKQGGTAGSTGIIEKGDPKKDYREQWIVAYYARTLFTESGVDIFSRKAEGLSTDLMRKLKIALTKLGSEGKGEENKESQTEFELIAKAIRNIKMDKERKDEIDVNQEGAAALDHVK